MKSRSPDQAWIICIYFLSTRRMKYPSIIILIQALDGSWFTDIVCLIPYLIGKEKKNLPISDSKEMVISFTVEVSVAKKRHRLLSTVQLTLYSIVIGIPVGSGQQETKISAELLWTKGPWKALLVLAHRVDNHTWPTTGWSVR